LSAAAGGGFSVESIDLLRNHKADVLKSAVAATKEAYRRAVDFLVTQIRVESAEVLPYKNQLTVLAEIFRCLTSPTAEQYDVITRWFWQTALSGYFGGWNTGGMAVDQAAVKEFAAGKTKTIEIQLPKPNADIWEDRTFRLNNAHAKLLAIVLAHHRPVDLISGQSIDISKALAWINAKEFHHFFPRKYLEKKGEKQQRINSLANFIMLSSASNKKISDSAPSQYLPKVAEAAGTQLGDWLASNLIPDKAWDAALNDDFKQFLRIRSEFIHAAVMAKCSWPTDSAGDSVPSSQVSDDDDLVE
jgi:hypothetical protein